MTTHWLERDAEFHTLKTLLIPQAVPATNLILWGRNAIGKASTLKAVLESLKRRYAWVLCCLTDSTEHFLTAVVTQLRRSHSPKAPSRLANPTRLLQYLPELCPKEEPLCYLVVESPERLAPSLIEMLIKTEEDPEIHLSIIFLAQSCLGWISASIQPPLALCFDGYTVEEMGAIVERELLPFNAHDDISRDFIKNIFTIKRSLCYLFEKFWQGTPADKGEKLNVAELNRQIMPYVSSVLKCLNAGRISDLNTALHHTESQKQLGKQQTTVQSGTHTTGLPLYNYDLVLFDPTQTTKRRRVSTAPAQEKKRRTLIQFDYERLFMISQRLMQHVDAEEDLSAMYTSVYASQFVTLESFGFIKRALGDPLKGARYVSSVEKEFATQLATGLKLNLPDFLET